VEPILHDLPDEFETERILLRAPHAGDGAAAHTAIVESAEHLRLWIPWANPLIAVEEEELVARQRHVKFLMREALWFYVFLKGTATLVGMTALHNIDWKIPRFELGYWVRKCLEGQGYATEAVQALTDLAFEGLGARRVEIHIAPQNEHSWHVAERAGYTLEGICRNACRNGAGELCDTRIYTKLAMERQVQPQQF
jgi:RimJ/RimL family protein N-acetyltransferase